MTFHISRTLNAPFDATVSRVVDALQSEGFGVLTDIDIKATLKSKLGLEFRDYRILGACNPPLAHRALELEDKIGTMLPCNVIVQATTEGQVEISAIDPTIAMQQLGNSALAELAETVKTRLERVLDKL